MREKSNSSCGGPSHADRGQPLRSAPSLLAAMLGRARPDVYLWEIRSLDPLPDGYRERYTNVQAAIGLASLPHLDRWTIATRARERARDGRSTRRSPRRAAA